MDARESKICRVGQQVGDIGEPMVQMKSKPVGLRIPSCVGRPGFLFYSGSTD